MSITKDQLLQIMPRLKVATPYPLDDLVWYLNLVLTASINTPLRAAAFLAQIAHESGELTKLEENLNYSWQRLRAVFRKYFPNDDTAKVFHRRPEMIANLVYANRMGNGPESSGDGWKYRGRSPIHLTGKSNYARCGTVLCIDLVNNPDLAKSLEHGFWVADWFWHDRHLNQLADVGDFRGITFKINGGYNGEPERNAYYVRAKKALGITE